MQRHFPWRDPQHVLRNVDAAEFSDLPSGENTILNFVIVVRPFLGFLPSIGHRIVANQFESMCPKEVRPQHVGTSSLSTSCAGLGYFAGRGSGLDSKEVWAPFFYYNESVASFFGDNDPLKSDFGSRR